MKGNRKIIVRLNGGLGNQMFQYATSLALSLDLENCDLKIDTSFINRYPFNNLITSRSVELDLLNVSYKEWIGRDWILSIVPHKIYYQLISKTLLRLNGLKLISEDNFTNGIKKESGDSYYLSGFFQSERYFVKHRERIIREFGTPLKYDSINQRWYDQICNTNSISVHIRRGDYLLEQNISHIGVLDKQYYENAFSFFEKKIENPVFYVFSEDIQWARENIKYKNNLFCYVDSNTGSKSYLDMKLMSSCKHNIVANSSFSWWGGWLNESSDKIVLAPEKWFANLCPEYDIVPNDWLKI